LSKIDDVYLKLKKSKSPSALNLLGYFCAAFLMSSGLLNGKGTFPESHPLPLGAGGQKAGMDAHFLDKADLIFAIGASCSR